MKPKTTFEREPGSLKEKLDLPEPSMPVCALHFDSSLPGLPWKPPFFVERHWHSLIEILLIRKGEFTVEVNLDSHHICCGEIVLFNAEDLHQIQALSVESIHDVIQFDPHLLESAYPDIVQEDIIGPFLRREIRFPRVIHTNNPAYAKLKSLFEAIYTQAMEQKTGWYGQCKLNLLEWMLLFAGTDQFKKGEQEIPETERMKIQRFKNTVLYMEQNFARHISLEELADEAGFQVQYFCRFFKEMSGSTPVQYLIRIRLDHACHLLRETTLSVLDISLECGFGGVSYFIRKFKEAYQMTPLAYRNGNSEHQGKKSETERMEYV